MEFELGIGVCCEVYIFWTPNSIGMILRLGWCWAGLEWARVDLSLDKSRKPRRFTVTPVAAVFYRAAKLLRDPLPVRYAIRIAISHVR